MASRERSAKKKRLMLTPDFSEWKTTAIIKHRFWEQQNLPGTVPVFHDVLRKYNSLGGEKIDIKKKEEQAQAEPSFFSKYWMYIMAAMFILPRLLGGEEPPRGAPTQR